MSLENQKCKNWVHIIIDGASGQKTQKYLKSLPKRNTIYISEIDSGIYEAMNKAWKIAKPKSFVFYLNARDVFTDPNSLAEATKALKVNPESNWGCTTHEEIDQNGEGWVCKLTSPPTIANQLYAFGYRSHQGVVMKADFIARLGGFNESFKFAADWDLIVKALQAEKPRVWSYPLARFELGGTSSKHLLEAHLELRLIRMTIMNTTWRMRILDDLWCSIYLKYFGFVNYWSPILNILQSNSELRKNKIAKAERKIFRGFKLNFGPFTLHITRNFSPRISQVLNIRNSLRTRLILKIHNSLGITPYSKPD